jgi:hypothetical protein
VTSLTDQAADAVASNHALGQRNFVLIIMLSCLVLQRFGMPAPISVPGVIGCVVAVWYLWTGVLSFDRHRVGIMLGLVGFGLIAVNLHKSMPVAMVTRISMVSFLYWLVITGFGALRFTRKMDERVFFRIVIGCLAFIAVCGLLAFFAQFAGVRIFSFKSFVPAPLSMEALYNVEIPLGGTIIKANGFFLVEPSTFSQFMALGLICEWMESRRPAYIALFLFAMFCSASGTGWMVVGAFLLYTGFTKGGRGLWVVLAFSCIFLLAFIVVSFIFPAITDSLAGRIHEINMQGTSGNERFVTPILVMEQVLHAAPWAFFTGIGPGGVESLAGITFVYDMNTPIKIILEYGVFELILYLTLILWNHRTERQNAVLLPLLVLLLIAGGNEHFPPILFPVLLMATVANLMPREEAAVHEAGPASFRVSLPRPPELVPGIRTGAG